MKIHEPPMTFKSPEMAAKWTSGLAKNKDPYGRACFRYASEWATRMEKLIGDGAAVESIAKQTSHDADDEGISGYMYGVAVSILSDCWIHGEAVGVQIGDEGERANESGGVLNPALLTINTEE